MSNRLWVRDLTVYYDLYLCLDPPSQFEVSPTESPTLRAELGEPRTKVLCGACKRIIQMADPINGFSSWLVINPKWIIKHCQVVPPIYKPSNTLLICHLVHSHHPAFQPSDPRVWRSKISEVLRVQMLRMTIMPRLRIDHARFSL